MLFSILYTSQTVATGWSNARWDLKYSLDLVGQKINFFSFIFIACVTKDFVLTAISLLKRLIHLRIEISLMHFCIEISPLRVSPLRVNFNYNHFLCLQMSREKCNVSKNKENKTKHLPEMLFT